MSFWLMTPVFAAIKFQKRENRNIAVGSFFSIMNEWGEAEARH